MSLRINSSKLAARFVQSNSWKSIFTQFTESKKHMRVDVAIRNSKHVFKGLRRVIDGVTVPTFSIKSQHRLGYTIWQVSFEDWISWSCISFFLTLLMEPTLPTIMTARVSSSPLLSALSRFRTNIFIVSSHVHILFNFSPSCQLCVCLCRCVKEHQPVWVETFFPALLLIGFSPFPISWF